LCFEKFPRLKSRRWTTKDPMRRFSISPFPENSLRAKEPALLLCRICGRPIPVEVAKTDSEGRALHEECYVLTIALEQAGRDRNSD